MKLLDGVDGEEKNMKIRYSKTALKFLNKLEVLLVLEIGNRGDIYK